MPQGSTKAGVAVANSGAGSDAAAILSTVKNEVSTKDHIFMAYFADKFSEGLSGPGRACRLALLTVLCALPAAVFLLAFTSMGYGETTFSSTKRNEHIALGFEAVFWLAFFFMYFLDGFTGWSRHPRTRFPRHCLLATMALCFVMGTVFSAGDYPYGPMCLLTVGLPAWLVVAKAISTRKLRAMSMEHFLSFLPAPMVIVAGVALVAWVVWIPVSGHTWNTELKAKYAKEVGCDDTNDCFEALLIWIGPLIVTLVYSFFAIVLWLLDHPKRQEGMAIKAFGASTLLVLFAMWIATSLAGVSEGTAGAIFMFAVSGFIATVMLVASTFGTDHLAAEASHWLDEFVRNNKNLCDWIKGMFVVTSAPIFGLYLCLSFLNQRVRTWSCCTSLTLPPEHNGIETRVQARRHAFTKRAQGQWMAIRRWDRTSVLLCAIILGIAFMCLNVLMAKFTILFLAWIIQVCKTLPLVAVVGIIVGVGITLFLLPPVPGAPIYVTAGIVIPAVAKDQIGLGMCIVFALALSLFNKLFAHFLQQCVIGTFLGNKLYVRQTCQVNSLMIKAFQLILAKPGLSIAKVAILIGGPDWPTSVLCGILKVPFYQTLIGTAPAIMLVTPCVLAGTFYYLSGEQPEENWDTAAAIMATVAAIVQCGSLVVASYFVEKTIRENREKIATIPDDNEVAAADLAQARRRLVYRKVIEWTLLPVWVRYLVAFNVCVMVLQCYMVQFYPTYCFRNFQLTDEIKDLPGGNAANMTRPAGWAVVALFALSCVLLKIFYVWASGRVTDEMNRDDGAEGSVAVEMGAKGGGGAKKAVEKPAAPTKSKAAEKPKTPPPGKPKAGSGTKAGKAAAPGAKKAAAAASEAEAEPTKVATASSRVKAPSPPAEAVAVERVAEKTVEPAAPPSGVKAPPPAAETTVVEPPTVEPATVEKPTAAEPPAVGKVAPPSGMKAPPPPPLETAVDEPTETVGARGRSKNPSPPPSNEASPTGRESLASAPASPPDSPLRNSMAAGPAPPPSGEKVPPPAAQVA